MYCQKMEWNSGDFRLTPLQLETLFLTNLLEFSVGRDLGALKEVMVWSNWKPFFGKNLLEVSTGRNLGTLKEVMVWSNWKPLLGKN